MLTFRKPTIFDIQYVADHMRQADRDEIKASHNSTPLGALEYAINQSRHISAALIDGVPCAIFGVVSRTVLSRVGCPWLLGTDEIYNNRFTFVRETRKGVAEMMIHYDQLVNYVHVNNRASIEWLISMGFVLDDPEPYGVYNELFHRFSMGY